MSIISSDGYKIIEEEVTDPEEICLRAFVLLLDLNVGETLAKTFVSHIEQTLHDEALEVSFITAYKDHVIPSNFAGLALIKWLTPEEGVEHLASSDFCFPLFIGYNNAPQFEDVSILMENFIRVETEARQYAYELKDSLKL